MVDARRLVAGVLLAAATVVGVGVAAQATPAGATIRSDSGASTLYKDALGHHPLLVDPLRLGLDGVQRDPGRER